MPYEMENQKEKKSFLFRINIFSMLPNILGGYLIAFYAINFLGIDRYQWVPMLKFISILIFGSEFVIGLTAHYILYNRISNLLSDFYECKLNEKETLNLFKQYSKVPFTQSLVVMSIFFIGSIVFVLMFHFMCDINTTTTILAFAECFYCSCLIATVSFVYTRALCSPDLKFILNSGLPKEEILKQKTFGRPLFSQVNIFILIPTVLTAILAFYVVLMGYYPLQFPSQWTYEKTQIKRIIFMGCLNFSAQFILIHLLNKQIKKNNNEMLVTLEDLEENMSSDKTIETDLFDELSYNQYLSNLMLTYLRNILIETSIIGQQTDRSAQKLQEIASETESTAIEQSTAINEIVATMEDANNLSKNIEDKISEVSDLAVQTADDVSALYSILESNLQKMSEIKAANEQTIQGIRDVNEKMENIWEVINLINSIADTTKIIAFNAELEATNVHEKGRNFKNVANEIRRLANGTMDSTKEIKDYINRIQTATNNLSAFSDNSTLQINNGIDLAKSLENSFTSISSSASESAESSADIKTKIDQETEAFKQILTTLQQINTGIESFSSSTHLVLESAGELQISVNELNNINEDSDPDSESDSNKITEGETNE